MNDVYEPLFLERVAAAIGAARAAASVKHSGVKGTIREILIRDLFRPLLPSNMGVGTGQILTCRNDPPSPQQDVVIYDRGILPPILFEESIGVFPVESVLATVEVKTRLTLAGLKRSYKSASTIHEYRYLEGRRDAKTGQLIPAGQPLKQAIAAIIALDSSLRTGDEINRYKQVHATGLSPLKSICVAGRGYWFLDNSGSWQSLIPKKLHQEVLFFIAGLLPMLSVVRATRGTPDLADYIK